MKVSSHYFLFAAVAMILAREHCTAVDTVKSGVRVDVILSALGAPQPECFSEGDQDQMYNDGTLYKRFPDLRDRYGSMVAVTFEDGAISNCSLVPYATDDSLLYAELQREECIENATNIPPVWPSTRCETGFSLVGGSCYYVTISKLTMLQAGTDACEALNSYVAIIDDQEEQDSLAAVLPITVYIALNDVQKEGVFVNPGQTGTPYTNWNGVEPNNKRNEDCTAMKDNKEFKWNDVSCTKKEFNVLCEQAPIIEETPQPYTCPSSNYLQYGTSCYLVTARARSYVDGAQACKAIGGSPAIISNSEQQQFLADELETSVYFGLMYLGGTFLYPKYGLPLYTSWAMGEPSGIPENYCVEMSDKQDFNWVHSPCNQQKPVLCEVPATLQ